MDARDELNVHFRIEGLKEEIRKLEDEILDCPATNYHAPTHGERNDTMIGIAKANIGDQLLFIGSGDLLQNPVRVRVIKPHNNFVGDLCVELEDDLQSETKFIKTGQTMGVMCSELRWPR